jgi:uncharacterized coiled-coil DUF342 family protein
VWQYHTSVGISIIKQMNDEQKEIVTAIHSLENKINKLARKATKCIQVANEHKVKIFNLREELRNLYLKLKEITEKIHIKKEPTDS